MFHLDFAKALLEEDEVELAIAILEKVNECTILEPQDHNRIKEANQLLSTLKN
jgi:3-dehydroquinate synthase class II